MASGIEIDVSKLADTVIKEMESYSDMTFTTLNEVIDSLSREGVLKLKSTSPKKSGAYSRGWTSKMDRDNSGSKKYGRVIHNKDKYELTHLLEKGHPIVRKGKVIGHANPIPHIGKVEQWIVSEFENRLMVKA